MLDPLKDAGDTRGMDPEQIRSEERKRIADALRRYFEEGPGTYRVLLDYLQVEYATGVEEGWLDLNNAISDRLP
jgi:hypothetical protein